MCVPRRKPRRGCGDARESGRAGSLLGAGGGCRRRSSSSSHSWPVGSGVTMHSGRAQSERISLAIEAANACAQPAVAQRVTRYILLYTGLSRSAARGFDPGMDNSRTAGRWGGEGGAVRTCGSTRPRSTAA